MTNLIEHEYPAVVIPLTTSSWMMLERNLLYTGVTRAKKLVVVRTKGAGPVTRPSPTGCTLRSLYRTRATVRYNRSRR